MDRVVMMVLGTMLLLGACGGDTATTDSAAVSADAQADAASSGDSVTPPAPPADVGFPVADIALPDTVEGPDATDEDVASVADTQAHDADGTSELSDTPDSQATDTETGTDTAPVDGDGADADLAADSMDALDTIASSCPESDPVAEAVFAACTQVAAAVEAEAMDLFPDYTAPALLTLTDQTPVEAPEVCVSEELPQSTEGTCLPVTAQFKLDMFTKLSSGELDMPAVPDTFNPFQAGNYTFWTDQCTNRAIENGGTLLTFLGGCTDAGACCPNAALDWIYLRGLVVGAQLLGEHLAEQLEDAGLTATYPPPVDEVPICQSTALVVLASQAALEDADKAAGSTPMCPGFAPDGVAETIGFTAQQTQYIDAIKQGVNAEAALISARLMGEGPCCLVSL